MLAAVRDVETKWSAKVRNQAPLAPHVAPARHAGTQGYKRLCMHVTLLVISGEVAVKEAAVVTAGAKFLML